MQANKLTSTIPAVSLTLLFLLPGCGSSSSSGGDDTVSDDGSEISGTAAAGAPMTGFVALKDAEGEVRTVSIDQGGNFSLDTEGLSAPFVPSGVRKRGSE